MARNLNIGNAKQTKNLFKETKKIYTVSEITREIRFSLENSFPAVWIEGEVSNFLKNTSGHCYLSLKDAGSVQNRVW